LRQKLRDAEQTVADLRVRRDTLLTANKKFIQREKRQELSMKAGVASNSKHIFELKTGAALCDAMRLCIMELTWLDVASQNVYRAVLSVATALNVELVGSFAKSMVLRIIDEGGLAGVVQLGEAMANASCKLTLY
jgi:hypothetical protein